MFVVAANETKKIIYQEKTTRGLYAEDETPR